MEKCRSSTHAATWTGVGKRAKKRATDMTRQFSGLPLLPELAGGEAEDVTGDGQPGHVLVAAAQARGWVAADDVAVDPGDRAVALNDRPFAWAELPPAAGEYGEVVCVLEVGAPGEVARMQGRTEVGGR